MLLWPVCVVRTVRGEHGAGGWEVCEACMAVWRLLQQVQSLSPLAGAAPPGRSHPQPDPTQLRVSFQRWRGRPPGALPDLLTRHCIAVQDSGGAAAAGNSGPADLPAAPSLPGLTHSPSHQHTFPARIPDTPPASPATPASRRQHPTSRLD